MSHFGHFSGKTNKQTKKTPSRTFLLFVFVANDDLVHVDILLICTCKETAKCVKVLMSVSRFLIKKKHPVSHKVSEVQCALSHNISVSLAREELPRHTNKPVVWFSNVGITSSKLKSPSTH